MSLRPRPTAVVAVAPDSSLEQRLWGDLVPTDGLFGRLWDEAHIKMMQLQAKGNAMVKAREEQPPVETFGRKILYIKGVTFGINEKDMEDAIKKALKIIENEYITTIVWEGDPVGTEGPEGQPAPQSFANVVEQIYVRSDKWVEFIAFKRRHMLRKALYDVTPTYKDGYRDQYLRPWASCSRTGLSPWIIPVDCQDPRRAFAKTSSSGWIPTSTTRSSVWALWST